MVLPHDIAVALAGTWQLLNQTRSENNGVPITDLGKHPVGLLIYDTRGYMSASMTSTDPDHIPPDRSPAPMTDADYALFGQHKLAYAGELRVMWENSTAMVGRLLGTNMTRDYVVTYGAKEVGGRDVLRLWVRDEAKNSTTNIYWVRGLPT
ncbi:Lipocalin-like domain-containing protein [Phaeosphaeriaceae sp. PMI808]|nr:Lipocalin-like domain-containing protein [Phaeosphaeriaceae sp. PMI808]